MFHVKRESAPEAVSLVNCYDDKTNGYFEALKHAYTPPAGVL
jgi:hypothetical protein